MMWNWLVSGLASGATLVLFDGSPFFDEGRVLWQMAEREAGHRFRHQRQVHFRAGESRRATER